MAEVQIKGTSLETNLQGYWSMDESSGTRSDSTSNGNNLTDNNTVGNRTGKIELAASFDNANENLSIADGSQTGLDITGDISVSAWLEPDTIPSTGAERTVISKWETSGDNRSYFFGHGHDGSNRVIRFYFSTDGTAGTDEFLDISHTLTASTWQHVVWTFDVSASTFEAFVNGSSVGTASGSGTSIYSGAATFRIGTYNGTVGDYDGGIDEIGIWDKVLTSQNISDLYNSGNGIPYELDDTTNALAMCNF